MTATVSRRQTFAIAALAFGLSGGRNPTLAQIYQHTSRSFGRKTAWFAIRSPGVDAILAAFQLQNIHSEPWGEGVWQSYDYKSISAGPDRVSPPTGTVAVTPPVNGWTLITGQVLWDVYLPYPKTMPLAYSEAPWQRLRDLSRPLGVVQFFSSYRTVGAYTWIALDRGTITRSYVGCDGETEEAGTRTPVEDMISAELDRQYDAKGALFPTDEDQVMQVAASWSLDPDRFDEDLSAAITGDTLTVGTLVRPQ